MNFKIIHHYDEMEDNGLMIADVMADNGLTVCQIEHTDMMGGFDEINGEINLGALAPFLVDLKTMIEDKGANFYAWLDMEVDGSNITFTDDTEPFAELRGNEAFVLDKEQMAAALSGLSSYFWEIA